MFYRISIATTRERIIDTQTGRETNLCTTPEKGMYKTLIHKRRQ